MTSALDAVRRWADDEPPITPVTPIEEVQARAIVAIAEELAAMRLQLDRAIDTFGREVVAALREQNAIAATATRRRPA